MDIRDWVLACLPGAFNSIRMRGDLAFRFRALVFYLESFGGRRARRGIARDMSASRKSNIVSGCWDIVHLYLSIVPCLDQIWGYIYGVGI